LARLDQCDDRRAQTLRQAPIQFFNILQQPPEDLDANGSRVQCSAGDVMSNPFEDQFVDRVEARQIVSAPVDQLADTRSNGIGTAIGRITRADARQCVVLVAAETLAAGKHKYPIQKATV
jgi:hypothetical protein